ncbi:Heat stress transcription factor C-1a [Dichanthelium oligosanthes]|uniref:Heat stress transcription factor C-1a n=1 Tax=Dichanthelium oligosanthes TaxID=888268 RepID=A0A1E5UWP9_9POAL|nr:Heat stress transcription factor C-1a [Dichanthelium oligosanthes]
MDGLHTELALGLLGCGGGDELQTAPFVAKTYQMVCDPRTDALVRWGRENNSFVVVDPAGFSRLLLPCFFKHSNFSSFVRQLNTYGFRKVHPDRWEFAHESFLRGQTHLLPRIVRRKKRGEGSGGGAASCSSGGEAVQYAAAGCVLGEDDRQDGDQEEREALLEEVQRLRREQTAIGEELAQMSRRLQATERRPDQLMSFLARLAEDPDGVTRHLVEQAAEKKRRRMQLSSHPISPIPPPPVHPLLALGSKDCDGWQRAEQKPAIVLPSFDPTPSYCVVQQVPEFVGGGNGGGGLIGMGLTADDTAVEAPFPFCLLGQGFF